MDDRINLGQNNLIVIIVIIVITIPYHTIPYAYRYELMIEG